MKRLQLIILIIAGLIEGTSTILLMFVAMPLKYMWGNPVYVKILGPVHGVLFVLLVALILWCWLTIPLSKRLTFWSIVAAIVPFGPFLVDVALLRMLRAEKAAAGDAKTIV